MSHLTLHLIAADLTAEEITALWETLTGTPATPEDRQAIRDELEDEKEGRDAGGAR